MHSQNPKHAIIVCCLLVSATVMALAGTDLVLPAVPSLPSLLGGDATRAQWVLAAFTAGSAIGLIAFGELANRFSQTKLLIVSLASYATLSYCASLANTLEALVAWRFVQGLSCACAAVVAPGIIRQLFSEHGAIKAMGILSSVESLAPALAPLAGILMLQSGGWQLSFWFTAIVVGLLCVLVILMRHTIPSAQASSSTGSYWQLAKNGIYWRFAFSQAAALAGLLVYVFAAPTIITQSMGGTLYDFVLMQIIGISTYIGAANSAAFLTQRYSAEKVIVWASWLSLFGASCLLCYGILGDNNPKALWLLFIPFNMGLGFRSPPCFYQALLAAKGDDARASALLILAIMALAAIGTVCVAPFIGAGLVAAASGAWVIAFMSLAVLFVLPKPATPSASTN